VTVLETARLALRRLTPADAAFIVGLLNDPSFVRFIGDRGVRTEDDARAYLREGPLRSYEGNGFGLYLVERKPDGVPLGICGLLKREALGDVDVGFALLPAYRAQGYAAEAARAVLDYGRDALGLRRIVAVVTPGNEASIRLLERLGLGYERAVRMPGEDADVLLFATDARPGPAPA
jgi:RimJ/RimL family protein N-acetyltransferase